MDFTFTFAAKTPVDIVDSTYTLLSDINGLSVSKLSLPPKASSALLVQLDKQVIRSTQNFVTEHNVCPASHITSLAVPDHVSSGAPAATAAGDRAGGYPSQISHLTPPTGANAIPGITPAESVLLGLSFLEAIQANKQLHYLLQQHGYTEPPSSSSSSGGSQAKPTIHAAGSNAVLPAVGQHQQVDFLIPMLTHCGVLESVTPVHDAAAVRLLKQRTWRSIFAPADEFRSYFGNHIGFYLAFLNSMTLWLLAPAAVSTFLTWALRSSGSSSVVGHTAHGDFLSAAAPAVIHSPLVPFLLIFHLLWSAAGLKLWKRQEAGLNHKWYSSSNSSTRGIKDIVAGARRQFEQPRQQQQPTGYASYNSVQGSQTVTTTAAAAAAPAGPAAAAAVGGSEIGRLPGSDVSAARWGEGVPAASLITPAAAGVRREYTGNWFLNPATNEAELLNPTHNQLLRLFISIAATLLLLLAAAAVLLLCLNVQGYIPPHHRSVFVADLASLSLPGHVFGRDSGMLLSQVPMALRVVAVTLFSSMVYGPAAKLLTAFENHRTVEGYAASLTAKQASLNALFTFAPVAYVGLLGAGAAAARAEVAGFFRIELIRRIVMEFLMPWIAYWLSLTKVRRQSNTVKHVTFDKYNNQSNPVKDAAGAVGALVEELTPRAAAAAAAAHHDSSSRVVVRPAVMLKPDTKVAVRVSHGSASQTAASSSVVSECLKPSYDIFADCWEINRDLGYMILFAALYPPAAVICLLYNLVKIKQDCLKLLVVYRRPIPAQLRGIGSWKAVLAVQVFAAVITNVFLSGLSTGQLALLLPTSLVPETIKTALVAAAAARPGSSTAANQMHDFKANAATAGPMHNVLQDMSAFGSGADVPVTDAATAAAIAQCTSVNSTIWQAANMCPNNASDALFDETLSTGWCSPAMHNLAAAAAPGHALSSAGTAAAAADHLLLLFLLEHALVIVMLLILWAIPSQPGVVRAAARQQQLKTMQLLQQQQQQWSGGGTADDAKVAYKVA